MSTEVLFLSTQEGIGVASKFARAGDENSFFDFTAGEWKIVFKLEGGGSPRLFLVSINNLVVLRSLLSEFECTELKN